MQTLRQFVAKAFITSMRFPKSEYVMHEGFHPIYARIRGPIGKEAFPRLLTIANIVAIEAGKGAWHALVSEMRAMAPAMPIEVECVQNPEFAEALLRHGFIETSYRNFRLPPHVPYTGGGKPAPDALAVESSPPPRMCRQCPRPDVRCNGCPYPAP